MSTAGKRSSLKPGLKPTKKKSTEGKSPVWSKRKRNYVAEYVLEEVERGNVVDWATVRNAVEAYEGGAR